MAPRARSPTSLRVDGGRRCGSALGRVGGDEFSVSPLGPRCTASIGVASAPRDAKTLHDLRLKADLALHAAKEQGGNTVGLTPSDEMVLKSSYYGRAQLARVKALAERQRTKGGDPAARGAR